MTVKVGMPLTIIVRVDGFWLMVMFHQTLFGLAESDYGRTTMF